MARIAVVTDLWPPFPGGAERYVFNVARELKRRGHEISVLTSYANAAEFDGIKPKWVSIGCHAYDNDPGHTHNDGWRDIQQFFSETQAQVVLTHHFFASEFHKEIFGALPSVQIVHNGRRNPLASLAVYNSNFTRARAGASDQDMVILPPAFSDIVAPSHGDFIGFIKPIPHKGVNFFYNLAARMPERNFMVLHGEWQQTEDIRRGLKNVFFMPPVHEMPTFYEKCRVLLVPSLQEDAGTVPQEAALNGIPCISSPSMGLSETNKGGLIVPLNEDLWVRAIRDLDNALLYEGVVTSQKTYIRSLNWPAQFDQLSEKIARLV